MHSARQPSITRTLVGVIACAFTLAACDRLDLATPSEHIARGKEKLAAKDPRGAEIDAKNALLKEPKNAQARLLLARAYVATHRGQNAEVELNRAEEFGLSKDATVGLRGRALLEQGQYGRVLKDILPRKGGGDPEVVAEVQEVRGEAQVGLGLYNEADASFDVALTARPNSPKSLFGKSRAASSRNDFPGALRLVDAGLAIEPKSTAGLLLKADLLAATNDNDAALTLYKAAVNTSPDDELVRFSLGTALLRARQLDAVREQIDAIQKKSPNSPRANYLLAVLSFAKGDYKLAFDAVQKVTAALPTYAPATLLTGAIQYHLGTYVQAEANLRSYVQVFPGSVPAKKLLAAVLLKANKPNEAIPILEALVAQPNPDEQTYALAGAAWAAISRPDRANQYFAKASVLDPKDLGLQIAYGMGTLAIGDANAAVTTFENVQRASAKNDDSNAVLVMTYLNQKEYKKAAELLQQLIKDQPKNASLYNLLGGVYSEQQDYENAKASFEKALALKPDLFPAALNLAQLDLIAKRADDARGRMKAVIAANPKNIDAMNFLANLDFAQGDRKSGIQWLEKAVQESPAAKNSYLSLVQAHLQNQDPRNAVAVAHRADEQIPNDVDVLVALANAQANAEDRDAAVATYGRVAGLRPKDPGVQVAIARLEAADGHLVPARAALSKALLLNPEDVEAKITLAELDTNLGQYAEAAKIVADLEKRPNATLATRLLAGDIAMGLRKYPVAVKAYSDALANTKSSVTATKLHTAMWMSGKKQEADDFLKGWMREHATDDATRVYMGGMLQLGGDAKEAQRYFTEALTINPNNSLALNQMALLLSESDRAKAVDYAERAYAQRPSSAAIADTLGWLLVQTGKLDRAKEVLEKAVARAPSEAEVRYHYAVALMKSGETAKAKTNLRQVAASADGSNFREEAKKLLAQM